LSKTNFPKSDSSSETEQTFSEEDRKFVLNFVDMFSAIKGKPLKIFFNPNSNRHYITYDKRSNEYRIFTDPFDKTIFWKTAIEHEISHLLFDTKFTTFKKYANKILENTPYELNRIGFKSIHTIYNVFEDMRIESWFGKYKQGFKARIIKTRKSLGKNSKITKEQKAIHPINALLNSRFYRNDLIKNTKYEICSKYIDESEFLNPKGSILLVKKFYDNVMLPFLKEQKEKEDQKKKEQEEKQKQKQEQEEKEKEKQKGKDEDSKTENDSEENDSEENDSEEKDSEEKDSEEKDSEEKDSEEKDSEENDSEEKDSEEKDSDENDSEENDSDENDSDDSSSDDSSSDDSSSKDSSSDDSSSDDSSSDDSSSDDSSSDDSSSDDSSSKDSSSDDSSSDDSSSKDSSSKDDSNSDIEINTLEDLEKLVDQLNEESDHKDYSEDNKERSVKIDFDEIEKQLEKSKEQGEKDFKELKEKLMNLDNNPSQKLKEFDSLINREYHNEDLTDKIKDNGFEINSRLASKLSRIFDMVRSKRKSILDTEGSQIEIKQYVNARFDSNTRVFKNESKQSGLNITLIHDMSGSMCNESYINGKTLTRSAIASNTIATMYKAIKKFPQIKLNVIGFTGRGFDKLQTVKVNKLNQVGKLNNYLNATILDLALIEAEKSFKKVNGKKFVIVLTDGLPDSPTQEIYNYYNYLVQKLFVKKQIGVFAILIGNEKEFMQKVFGSNFATCDQEDTEKELIKVFEKTIKENILK